MKISINPTFGGGSPSGAKRGAPARLSLCLVCVPAAMSLSAALLSEAVGRLFEDGLDFRSVRARAAEVLRRYAGCDAVTFAVWNPQTGKLSAEFDPPCPAAAAGLEGFSRHFQSHPCFNFDPLFNGGRPFARADFISGRVFRSMPVFAEGFRPCGFTDHAAMFLGRSGPEVWFAGLERAGGVFTPAHRERMEMLHPHIVNAFRLARQASDWRLLAKRPGVFAAAGLTPRQETVLRWLAEGKTLDETARILGIRLATVKEYCAVIYERLGVENRSAALMRAEEIARAAAPLLLPPGGGGTVTVPAGFYRG